MGVFSSPAAKKDFAHVRFVVAVGILKEFSFPGMNHDDAAAGKNETSGHAQLVGENRELVGFAISVRVLANFNAIVALARSLEVVGIIYRLRHPEPTAY